MPLNTGLYSLSEIKGSEDFDKRQRFIAMTPQQIGDFEALVDLLGDGYMLADNATHFACSEAETIADFLRSFGHGQVADTFLGHHAEDDDEGDMHEAVTDAAGYVTGYRHRTDEERAG